jgi:hypothetical protein
MLMFGLRLGNDPRVVVTTTPKPVKIIREPLADPATVVTRGTGTQCRAPRRCARRIVESRAPGRIAMAGLSERSGAHPYPGRTVAREHRPTTVPEHMPSAHRRYRDWTHERIRHEAQAVGPDAAVLIDVILRSRPHPEQGFRSCVGILRLVKRYGAERVDAACARALVLGTRSYTSVAAILKNRREPSPPCSSMSSCARGPSRAGLPFLRRHPAPGQALWRRTGWCRLRPRAGARHPVLHLGRRHPEERPRARPQRRRRAAAADPRLPSPSISMTLPSLRAAATPIAAGRPEPIAPKSSPAAIASALR